MKKKKKVKTAYLLFCDSCNAPKEIPDYILATYWAAGVNGEYCLECNHITPIPEHLKKLVDELTR